MRKFSLIFILMTGLLISPGTGYAQDISIEAAVDSKTVALDSTLQLILTIQGTQNVDPVDLPAIAGFDSQYLGPSTRISIVNGQQSVTKNFIYLLYPRKTGTFQIPSISMTINGQTYTTQPIKVEVVASRSQSKPLPGALGNQAPQTGQELMDQIFVIMGTPVTEAYVNERVPLTIKLFINNLNVQDVQYPQFEHSGFSVDPFAQPRQYRDVIAGIPYSVVEFQTFIYPTRVGELSLGPARLSCNILFEDSRRKSLRDNGSDPFDSFFNDDFFDGFFRTFQKRPVTLESADLFINVLPLPEEGKPADFSGAVGVFDFEASAGPLDVKVGDPITLKEKVWGTGNLSAVELPRFEDSEKFKVYDPEIKEEQGGKILEQVLIPKKDTITEIPALNFTYFDTQQREYVTITKGPFPVKVAKPAPGEEFKAVGLGQSERPSSREQLGRDIVFIKDEPGVLRPKGAYLFKQIFFWLLVLVLCALWIGTVWFYKRTHRLQTDVVYARRLAAPKKAKKGLAQARHFLQEGQQKEFYDSIFKVLQEYFADKFHLPVGAVTVAVVESRLRAKTIEPGVLANIRTVFEQCDMVRFASVRLDEPQMRSAFKMTEEVIDYLERRRA